MSDKLNKKEIIKFLKKMSKKHLGTSDYWKELGEKFKNQKAKCFYTNMRINLGINASIDHIIPLCHGGKKILSNVCWSDKNINYAKNSFSVTEFKKYLLKLKESLENSCFLNNI